MLKYSDEWCAAVAGELVDVLAKYDASESDVIICCALSMAADNGTTARQVLRDHADALELDAATPTTGEGH